MFSNDLVGVLCQCVLLRTTLLRRRVTELKPAWIGSRPSCEKSCHAALVFSQNRVPTLVARMCINYGRAVANDRQRHVTPFSAVGGLDAGHDHSRSQSYYSSHHAQRATPATSPSSESVAMV